jgi:hypothetical protein
LYIGRAKSTSCANPWIDNSFLKKMAEGHDEAGQTAAAKEAVERLTKK